MSSRQKLRKQSSENRFIQNVLPKLPEGCTKDYFTHMSGWYIRRSHNSKRQYYALTFLSSAFSGLILILTTIKGVFFGFSPFDIGVALLTFFSSMSLLGLNVLRSAENWVRFRGCAEGLKAEACRFLSKIGEYEKLDDEHREKLFIEKLLDIAGSEKDLWSIELKGKNCKV